MPRFTIGGRPALASKTEAWPLTAGVRPSIAEFDMIPGDAKKLLSGGPGAVSLKIDNGVGKKTEIAELYVLEATGGDDPRFTRVRVADRRWFWSRGHIARSYNVRRHVGFKRLGGGALGVLGLVEADVWYAPWSLPTGKGGQVGTEPWTAEEILQEILREVMKIEGADSASFVIDPAIKNLKALPVENLILDDSADQALGRVLKYLPQADVTVDADGTVRIYSRASGAEKEILKRSAPELVSGGHIELVERARVRPKEIHVLFDREIEIRFDANEPASKGATRAENPGTERIVQNVLPVPDFELDVPGLGKVAQGTYITFAQALNAWGAPPGLGSLDFVDIRRALVPFMDLWAGVRIAGARVANADWASRIAAIVNHFRRTYRIDRRIMDRVYGIEAYRVGTENPETGTHGPAMAYADYCIIGSQRTLILQASGGDDMSYASNVKAYPDDDRINSLTKPSPAKVSVLDSDQGIIHLDFLVDEFRTYEMVLPSQMDNIPTSDLSAAATARSLFFDAVPDHARAKIPELASAHKTSVILTVLPACPNSDARLHRIIRKPSDVKDLLPGALAGNLDDARGPILEVRVSRAEESARVVWSDRHSEEIEKAIGIREGIPNLDPVTINLGGQADIGTRGASLDAIATARAAQAYASFVDRHEGTADVILATKAKIDGWLKSVLHGVEVDGVTKTTFDMVDQSPNISPFALMPASTRSLILKLARPGKT